MGDDSYSGIFLRPYLRLKRHAAQLGSVCAAPLPEPPPADPHSSRALARHTFLCMCLLFPAPYSFESF